MLAYTPESHFAATNRLAQEEAQVCKQNQGWY